MSRFTDRVKAILMHPLKEKNVFPPLEIIMEEGEIDFPDRLKKYKIGVGFWIETYCSEEDLRPMTENVIREIKEIIYGDVRERFIQLERTIYNQDMQKTRIEVRDLMKEIFE